jgi:hypothetical protein
MIATFESIKQPKLLTITHLSAKLSMGARHNHRVVACLDSFYVIGGEDYSGLTLSSCESIKIKSVGSLGEQWQPIE